MASLFLSVQGNPLQVLKKSVNFVYPSYGKDDIKKRATVDRSYLILKIYLTLIHYYFAKEHILI